MYQFLYTLSLPQSPIQATAPPSGGAFYYLYACFIIKKDAVKTTSLKILNLLK